MALIKCTECGKEVSENAAACPNCGNPITKQPLKAKTDSSRNSLVSKFLWGIGIAIIAFIVYAIAVAPSQQMTPEKAHNLLEESQKSFEEKMANDEAEAREYIRIIQSDYATNLQKRKAYNELIKKHESFSKFSIEEIERMK